MAAGARSDTIDTLIVALSDLHAGLRLSLLNPSTKLIDANGQPWTPELTTTQRYLWRVYLKHRNKVKELRGDRRLVLLLLGDLTQGLKHWSGVWGTTLYDHIAGALAALEPYLELGPAVIRIAAGTESHTQDGTSELLIARELARMLPHCDVDLAQHYKSRVNGVMVDYAHHGPGAGIRQWTSGNVAGHYLKSLMLEELVNGDIVPRVVLRAHVHRAIWKTEQLETKHGAVRSDLVVCPGYAGINPYARQAARSPLTQTHGCIAVQLDDGAEPVIHQLSTMVDVRKEEEL